METRYTKMEINNLSPVIDYIKTHKSSATLLALDIDETILDFGIDNKWWKSTYDKYYEITNDRDISNSKALEDWERIVTDTNPVLMDPEGFNQLIKSDIDIVFITARTENMKNITLKHFEHVGIPSDDIIFCNHGNKGTYLLNYIMPHDYDHIIFIDDIAKNIINVQNALADKVPLNCFQYKKLDQLKIRLIDN